MTELLFYTSNLMPTNHNKVLWLILGLEPPPQQVVYLAYTLPNQHRVNKGKGIINFKHTYTYVINIHIDLLHIL